ncbi:MAG: formyltetrahydrofolate deformylase [Deltaproteobacteria bacterium]|nr:formyltetrahydrofolate deformylase [Deltaproteobacteria bacterium]
METTARLTLTCPDSAGIIAAVAGFLHAHNANITALDSHSTDPEGGRFFLRLEFQTPHLDLSLPSLDAAFQAVVASRFEMAWKISDAAHRRKMAIFVSKYDHALLELLWRWRRGELPAEISMVVSNHDDLREAAVDFGIPYHHIPVDPSRRDAAEAEALDRLEGAADLIVLARYMQILSPAFVARYPNQIINIHHSFLPAFVGADPYQQAHRRGVKLIGATAHYVTEDLDQGPIIEQDVSRVSHRHPVHDLKRLGRDLERQVLARAVKWHLEDRVIVLDNKTVILG